MTASGGVDGGEPTPTLATVATWFYGVLVALAISAAMGPIVPRVLDVAVDPQAASGEFGLDAARLLAFLFLIVRFYFGSIVFFASLTPPRDEPRPAAIDLETRASAHFFLGLFHFLLFFFVAMTIDRSQPRGALFPYGIGVLLLYDIAWYVMTTRFGATARQHGLVFTWMLVNLFTVRLAVSVSAAASLRLPPAMTEGLALTAIALASFAEMVDLSRGSPWVLWVADHLQAGRRA